LSWVLPPIPPSTYVLSRSRFPRSSSLSCAAGSRRRAGLPKSSSTLQALARYWTTEYDWRRVEARLNALPQFTIEIDEVDIHFIHVRSRHENALPLIMTHGWPGSVIELLDTIGPLTDPTAHGGTPEDAFHLVLPSLPGYGFSGEPAELGWEAGRVARAWAELMHRLGYPRYVAQGGDVGALGPRPRVQAPFIGSPGREFRLAHNATVTPRRGRRPQGTSFERVDRRSADARFR
jgi:hypothetical protein